MTNEDYEKLLLTTSELLSDLIRCSSFYHNAIEIDMWVRNSITGLEFEERIIALLTSIDELNLNK